MCLKVIVWRLVKKRITETHLCITHSVQTALKNIANFKVWILICAILVLTSHFMPMRTALNTLIRENVHLIDWALVKWMFKVYLCLSVCRTRQSYMSIWNVCGCAALCTNVQIKHSYVVYITVCFTVGVNDHQITIL